MTAETHDRIRAAVLERRTSLESVARQIHARPELRFEERHACGLLVEELRGLGLSVEVGIGGLETAFRAAFGPADAGAPRVVIMAEYDALPGVGHACGHHLIAAGALGAAAGLLAVGGDLPGRIELIGTPAEEGGGGKVRLIEAGAFDGVGAAMMFHPYNRDLLWKPALASDEVELAFAGQAAHAAAAPWDGRSALTAALAAMHLVDAVRVHFRDGVRVHGFVKRGGEAVNIIPDQAAVRFSVRAPTRAGLDVVRERVLDCGRGAALATRTELTVAVRRGYSEMRNNRPLYQRFGVHFDAAGGRAQARTEAEWEAARDDGVGSTDAGDVSQVCPTIHPYVAVCTPDEAGIHQHAFADASVRAPALAAMLKAAQALACTAWDFLADPALREAARADWSAAG